MIPAKPRFYSQHTIVKPRVQTPTILNLKPTPMLAFSPPSAPLGQKPRHGVTWERKTARWRKKTPTAEAGHPSANLHNPSTALSHITAAQYF